MGISGKTLTADTASSFSLRNTDEEGVSPLQVCIKLPQATVKTHFTQMMSFPSTFSDVILQNLHRDGSLET